MRASSPALILLLVVGCSEPATGPGDKAGDTGPIDAGDPETCVGEAPDHWPGCLLTAKVDPEGDGRHHTVVRTQYDGLGRKVSEDSRAAKDYEDWTLCGWEWLDDTDFVVQEWCVGRSTYAYTWTHDASGHPVGKTYDAGWDDEPDKSWAYETDDAGRILEAAQDQDLDGTTDSYNRFTYDEAGHVLTETWDYDADGTDDYVRTYSYDPQSGELISEEVDSDADGTLDDVTTWARDGAGNLLERVEDDGADGMPDLTTTYTWTDCKVTEAEELDIDGNIARTLYTYDAAHRRSMEEVDNGADMSIESRIEYAYDCPF